MSTHDPRRRTLLKHLTACCPALALPGAWAQASGPKVDERDAGAVSLGYRVDTTRVDTRKYPQHTTEQKCSNCNFFVGRPADAFGACPLFADRQVAGPGWCSAWVKKAG